MEVQIAEKVSKLKHCASTKYFFEILVDFGMLAFFMFLGAGKRQATRNKYRILAKREIIGVFNNPVRVIKLRF